MARSVSATPKRMISTGSGKAPSAGRYLVSSAITTMRSLEVATIFSWRSAAPPPLIRLKRVSISSAPSTVRSMRSTSSGLRSGTLSSSASQTVALEVATPIDVEAGAADALGEQPHEPSRGRAGAEPERHPVIDHLEGARRGGAFGDVGRRQGHGRDLRGKDGCGAPVIGGLPGGRKANCRRFDVSAAGVRAALAPGGRRETARQAGAAAAN